MPPQLARPSATWGRCHAIAWSRKEHAVRSANVDELRAFQLWTLACLGTSALLNVLDSLDMFSIPLHLWRPFCWLLLHPLCNFSAFHIVSSPFWPLRCFSEPSRLEEHRPVAIGDFADGTVQRLHLPPEASGAVAVMAVAVPAVPAASALPTPSASAVALHPIFPPAAVAIASVDRRAPHDDAHDADTHDVV